MAVPSVWILVKFVTQLLWGESTVLSSSCRNRVIEGYFRDTRLAQCFYFSWIMKRYHERRILTSVHTSLNLRNVEWEKLKVAFGHGARVRHSLGTSLPFLPTPQFGHGTRRCPSAKSRRPHSRSLTCPEGEAGGGGLSSRQRFHQCTRVLLILRESTALHSHKSLLRLIFNFWR